MRVGSILQKIGDKWGWDEIGQYVIIFQCDATRNLYWYRYESMWDNSCVHMMSGPWDIVGLNKDFVLVGE